MLPPGGLGRHGVARCQQGALEREEAALEKRLRRLEADVQMIAPGSAALERPPAGDYLGALVADVAAAAVQHARAAAEEQEPVLAATLLGAAARQWSPESAAAAPRDPLEQWWRQLLAERAPHDGRWYDGEFDGQHLRFSTRRNGTTARLSLSGPNAGAALTGYRLGCDLGGLLPVRELERAANRLLLEPAGSSLSEFVAAHVWPAMEHSGLGPAPAASVQPEMEEVDAEAAAVHAAMAEAEAALALAKAKALLRQNHMLPTAPAADNAPASVGTVQSPAHPSRGVLEDFEQKVQAQAQAQAQRRPVPPPSDSAAGGRHSTRRQQRPAPLQVESTESGELDSSASSEKPSAHDPPEPPPQPPLPSQPPTPGTPRPANRRPKRPPSAAAVATPSSAQSAGRSQSAQVRPAPTDARVPAHHGAALPPPPQAANDARRAELLASLARLRSPGSLRDRFKIGSVVGTGQSTVRHAVCLETGREYAVKYIRKDHGEGGALAMLEELITECALMNRLRGQPSILQLAGVFESDSCYEIVSEYCEGGDLFGLLIERIQASESAQGSVASSTGAGADAAPLFTEAEAAAVLQPVTAGVAACHRNGIVHRDLKPENVLLRQARGSSGEIVLADFGLAADVSSGKPLFQSCGTVEFVAPEVCQFPCAGYNQSCDIWSLGILLYILICGYPPYQTMAELMQLRDDTPLRFPHDEWATVSETLIELIRSMLDRRPDNRPKAVELLEHPWLCGSIDGMDQATLAPNALSNLRRWNAKRKLRACLLALIAGRRMKALVLGLSVEALVVELAVERTLPEAVSLCRCFTDALESQQAGGKSNGGGTAQQANHIDVDKAMFVDVLSRVWLNGNAVSPALAVEHFDAFFVMSALRRQDGEQDGDGTQREDSHDHDQRQTKTINWKGFCLALASLLPGVDKETKLRFAFDLFDEDRSGSIDEMEFASMIRCLLVGKCIEAQSLDVILQAEFEVADTSGDGSIDWREFVSACDHCPTIVGYFKSLERLSTHTQREHSQ